jgi:hypothetical protein
VAGEFDATDTPRSTFETSPTGPFDAAGAPNAAAAAAARFSASVGPDGFGAAAAAGFGVGFDTVGAAGVGATFGSSGGGDSNVTLIGRSSADNK